MLERWDERLKQYPYLTAAVLGLVTFATYARALANTFVYDDEHQILENPFVLNPHLWRRIFTGSVWSFQGIGAGNDFYRPLQIFSYWILYRLAGPNPAIFHLAQLLLYALTVWLVYRVGSSLLRSEWMAFVGALLWMLHPLHVEAVAWIGGWPEVGFSLLYLTGFLLFLRAEASNRHQFLRHGLASAVYLPALFFKEMAASFPLLVLAYWFCYPSGSAKWLTFQRRAAHFLPYAVALATYLAARHAVLGRLVRLARPWKISPSVVGAALALLGQHTKMFFWPAHLSAFRDFDLASGLRSPWPWLTLAVIAAALWIRRREPRLSFLILWWPVTLLPCLDIRQLSIPLLADRFSYIPSVGLCLAISWIVLGELPRRLPNVRPAWIVGPCLAGLLAVMVLWATRTAGAVREWHDNETLVSYSLRQSPGAAPLHIVQGWILEYQNGDLDGAAREFETALQLNQASLRPLLDVTYNAEIGLGQVAYRKGNIEEAIEDFHKAIRLLPNHTEAYQVLGALYFPSGDYEKSAEYLLQAVRVDPQNVAARFMLGTCWMKLGKYREAAGQFRAAIAVDPTYREAYEAEARALEASGDSLGATEVRTALRNQ